MFVKRTRDLHEFTIFEMPIVCVHAPSTHARTQTTSHNTVQPQSARVPPTCASSAPHPCEEEAGLVLVEALGTVVHPIAPVERQPLRALPRVCGCRRTLHALGDARRDERRAPPLRRRGDTLYASAHHRTLRRDRAPLCAGASLFFRRPRMGAEGGTDRRSSPLGKFRVASLGFLWIPTEGPL